MRNLKPARSASHAQGACVSRLSRRAIQRRWRKPCALQSAHACELAPGRAVCGERVLSATEQYLLLAFFGRELFGERPPRTPEGIDARHVISPSFDRLMQL